GRTSRLPIVAAVGLGLLSAAVVIGLIVYFFSKDADKAAQRVFVRVGACYHDRGGEGVLVTEAYQPCTAPHDREVVGLVSFPDPRETPYPGRDQLAGTTANACPARFRAYVGAPYPAANLVIHLLVPTPDEWDAGFRDGVCGVGDASGAPLTGTVKGRAAARS
ncbi:MAG TPA: septum formation family protein, partial [Acidimicrobiales bacterium]|nr:septum formation family protein [Acidimicrobiales bacterium]